MYFDLEVPKCHTFDENKCMIQEFYQLLQNEIANCSPPKYDTQYEGNIIREEHLVSNNSSDRSVMATFRYESRIKTLKEEIRIHDEASLVGSLGGTLGLFIGFSFHGFICYWIDKLFSFVNL